MSLSVVAFPDCRLVGTMENCSKKWQKHGKHLWKSQKSRQRHGIKSWAQTSLNSPQNSKSSIGDHHCMQWKGFICGISLLRNIKIHISTMMSRSPIKPEWT